MAKGNSLAAAKAAEQPDRDWSGYRDKPPTDTQARMADWVIEKTGLSFSSKAAEAAFRDGIRLGVALRIPFQASPENQAVRSNGAAEAAPAPAKKAAKAAAAPAKKASKKAAAAAEPEAEPATDEETVVVGKTASKPRKASKKAAPGAKVAPF
jgi:hypothetical protein